MAIALGTFVVVVVFLAGIGIIAAYESVRDWFVTARRGRS